MAIKNLKLIGVNGSNLDPQDSTNTTLIINENLASGTIVAKITNFDATEQLSQLTFAPTGSFGDDLGHYEIVQATSRDPTERLAQRTFAPAGSCGDDLGHYEIVQATSNGPNNGNGPEWVVGDWVVRVKNGGPVEFNYEDPDGPTDAANHLVGFASAGKN